MKKMLFILNPVAGKKKSGRQLADIINLFNRAGYEVDVHITEAPGDGKKQIIARAEHRDMVVCCGGDGTFNETVSGVLESGVDLPIGYIPAGSTNDFASTLGLPVNPMKAADLIINGTPKAVDVGLVGDSKFTYIASFGAFTRASYSTSQSAKNMLGHAAYILEGLNELSQIRKIYAQFDMDGEKIEGDFLFGAICNSTSVAGVLKLDPKLVDLQDGRFEVLLERAPKDISELPGCIHALTTQTYDSPMLVFRSAEKITVTMDPEIPWTLDGEKKDGQEQMQICNLCQAVRVVM